MRRAILILPRRNSGIDIDYRIFKLSGEANKAYVALVQGVEDTSPCLDRIVHTSPFRNISSISKLRKKNLQKRGMREVYRQFFMLLHTFQPSDDQMTSDIVDRQLNTSVRNK